MLFWECWTVNISQYGVSKDLFYFFKEINTFIKHGCFTVALKTYILTKDLYIKYKPDSKKVGTLYKLWIKKECNNLQIS